jgi:phosphopantothenoylcysteine decarboxylase / phosphopantothenate---cysteine ligase
MLKNKKILLGISGSIAAYKSILLTRELKKLGADVKVILTDSALDFVTPTTLSTLSENPVYSSFFKNKENGEWVNHVHLGKWADLFIIAPLSANTLSKLISGNCDNLLIATYLSADCKVIVAPAMDLDMYSHFTTQQNLDTLRAKQIDVIDAGEGSLASGLVGKGRMAEPEEIIDAAAAYFSTKYKVSGKRVIVTAGPTYEAIDPVRFIGNHSSGKMGYRIADELANRGAIVTLVSGPSNQVSQAEVETVRVVSAKDMFDATVSRFDECDLVIMAAAVADYKLKNVATKKLKKESTDINAIELMPTVDILKHLGSNKKHQKLVGFALETDNELANATSKLIRKNLDMLVLNSLNDKGAGFGTDTNKVTFVFHESIKEFSLKKKEDVAVDIANEVEAFF